MIDLCQRYHVITAKDELLLYTDDFSQALRQIKDQKNGTRLIRSDGVMLAYASTQSGGRIKKGFPKKAIFVGAHIEREAPDGAPLM